MQPPFTLTYDEHSDVLYISGSDNRPAYGRGYASQPGVLLRFATDNGELVGITLIDATKIKEFPR